ncbi:MAG TPA: PEGA domain-containing protein [Candidatus Saccharimonadales bacterium]
MNMDFLDPRNKRSYNIRLSIGFLLSALIIILGTLILAYITAGYTIDTKTGQVVQNGLIFINSTPVSANIYLNHQYTATTNSRLELRAGNYNLSLSTSGYDTWSTNVYLLGGDVDELTYPLLVPSKPIVSTIAKYSTKPQVFTQTPDKHWLLVSSTTQANSFDIYDQTNTKTAVDTATIPSNLLVSSTATNSFTVVQWASDSQYVLLKDESGGVINYIVFNYLTPANSYNVNQTFSVSFNTVKLLNAQYDKPLLFDQTSGNLYLGDFGTKQASLILSKVIDYVSYSTNKFLFVTDDSSDSRLSSIEFSNLVDKTYLVKNVNETSKYMLNISSYGGNYYYLIGGGGVYDYVYRNLPSQPKPNKLPLPYTLIVSNSQPQNVSNSGGQRYIALQSGNNFSVYDIQTQDHYRYTLSSNLSDPNFASWIDDNRFISFSSGKMIIFDFDGTNIFNIAKADNSFDGLFSPNFNAVYFLNYSSANNDWIVNRAGMIANQS